jgi:hypothetical protein
MLIIKKSNYKQGSICFSEIYNFVNLKNIKQYGST